MSELLIQIKTKSLLFIKKESNLFKILKLFCRRDYKKSKIIRCRYSFNIWINYYFSYYRRVKIKLKEHKIKTLKQLIIKL